MNCARCNGSTTVVDTRTVVALRPRSVSPYVTFRERACRSCGTRQFSEERVVSVVDAGDPPYWLARERTNEVV